MLILRALTFHPIYHATLKSKRIAITRETRRDGVLQINYQHLILPKLRCDLPQCDLQFLSWQLVFWVSHLVVSTLSSIKQTDTRYSLQSTLL